MNQRFKNWIIGASAALILGAASVGLYFGIVPEKSPLSDNVMSRFEKDSPTGRDSLDLSSLSADDSKMIKEADKVYLSSSSVSAYYFGLSSYDGSYGSLNFAIGVKDSVVTYYHFIDAGAADDLGAGQAQDNEGKRFVGYTLGGEDVRAGATAEETYSDRKKAVDAALTFVKGRD